METNRGDAAAATRMVRVETSRGDAAAATRIVREDESRRRRGRDIVRGDHRRAPQVRIVDLPIEGFVDYSALALHHATKAVAITSQENSQIWIGSLTTGSNGEFDPLTAEFEETAVYDMPRAATCAVQYCNVEGIAWVEDGGDESDAPRVLVGVSDKMKSKGKQAFTCLEKDQSFHLFQLP